VGRTICNGSNKVSAGLGSVLLQLIAVHSYSAGKGSQRDHHRYETLAALY
jgi:hypothetical protein